MPAESREEDEWLRSSRVWENHYCSRGTSPSACWHRMGGILTYPKVLLRRQKSNAGLRVCSISALSQLHLLSGGVLKMFSGATRSALMDSTLGNWTKCPWGWCVEHLTGFSSPMALCAWWFVLLVLFWSVQHVSTTPPPCEKRQLHFLLKCLTGWHLAF